MTAWKNEMLQVENKINNLKQKLKPMKTKEITV